MKTIEYSDLTGHGVVQANTISIYVYGNVRDEPVNPIIMIGPLGTFHFGTNRVLFVLEN